MAVHTKGRITCAIVEIKPKASPTCRRPAIPRAHRDGCGDRDHGNLNFLSRMRKACRWLSPALSGQESAARGSWQVKLLGSNRKGKMTTKSLMIAAAILGLLAWRAEAADSIPSQFVGRWCAFATVPVSADEKLTLYGRSNKGCVDAENELIAQPTSVFAAGEVTCKLAKIATVAQSKMRKLKLDCKHVNGESWTYSAYFSQQPRSNRLIVQEAKED